MTTSDHKQPGKDQAAHREPPKKDDHAHKAEPEQHGRPPMKKQEDKK